MSIPNPPDYAGSGLVNLMASIEVSHIGSSVSPVLSDQHARHIDHGDTTVLVLFDGLGAAQLDHREATDLAADLRSELDAPFPSTTTVSLSTVSTGLAPGDHGMLGYLMWLPEAGKLVNTIHMTSAWGEPLDLDLDHFLPEPNLWERLLAQGVEPVVVQPSNFATTPLTRAMYRGARFEGYWDPASAVDVTLDVASHAGRLVFLYVPFVDLAAHLSGQRSDAYAQAMRMANSIWLGLRTRLTSTATLIGTADHGHSDIPDDHRIVLSAKANKAGRLYGDGRALYVMGDHRPILEEVPGTWIARGDLDPYWGPNGLSARFEARAPDGVVLVDEGHAALSDVMNPAMVGHHGGLTRAERLVPLMVRG